MLKYKEQKIIEVQDWDDLVIKTYGRPYSFQQQDGCQGRGIFNITIPSPADDFENTVIPEVVNHKERGVSFAAWRERDPDQPINDKTEFGNNFTNLWWARNFYPDIQMVANDLHRKGLIESGKYIINIDW